MIAWDEEFCNKLVEKGLYVIRFDNRDVGLSEKFDDAGIPNIVEAFQVIDRGEKYEAPYSVDDMADDAVGLLDALEIEKAHICGASMGGMIAQTVAILHPSRVLSLTSIMSGTGNPELPKPKPESMAILVTPRPDGREANIEHSMMVYRTIGSPGFPMDENIMREKAAFSFDRSFYPQGSARQIAAVLAHGDRKPALASVKIPALVIHGADDPLVPVEHGKDTAEAIPGAEMMIIDGMGHDLPTELWKQITDGIAAIAAKA